MVKGIVLDEIPSGSFKMMKLVSKSVTKKYSFLANVFFGSPVNQCSGHGICRIHKLSEEENVENKLSPCSTICLINVENNGSIRFDVLKSSISVSLRKRQFSNDLFQVDDDFDLSPFLPSSLVKVISSGYYTYTEDLNYIRIFF